MGRFSGALMEMLRRPTVVMSDEDEFDSNHRRDAFDGDDLVFDDDLPVPAMVLMMRIEGMFPPLMGPKRRWNEFSGERRLAVNWTTNATLATFEASC
mmetsp:Transcript_1945/g.5158  ORF Transcript_1945/g.5158 Transcript_1945/m.5158 type:complete len:97 (+) Transcript_1945:167-457(+)